MAMTRQAVYQSEQRAQAKQKQLAPVYVMVMDIRRYLPRLGARKLYHLLKPKLEEHGIKLGRDGLLAYLRQHHLLIKPFRRYTKTTNSRHWLKKYPNLLPEQEIKRPEQVFVSDITYVESAQGVHYLSLVTDACSRQIMGYKLAKDLKAKHSAQALLQAINKRQHKQPLIHHSDRGVQYCSSEYQSILAKHDILPSMTEGYDCYQNALAERMNGILKQEFLLHRCQTFEELKQLIKQSVLSYNRLRPHLSLGMMTPEQMHKKASC